MTDLALIRHGMTAWNETGRIQGRREIPLSEAGRRAIGDWRLPPELRDYRWVSSPLIRALETARLLGAPKDVSTDPRLMEMDWGDWEGFTLPDLREKHGAEMRANEARGPDFRPPGGESEREVLARVADWLRDVGARGAPTLAIVHKGIIRATIALATGWDLESKPKPEFERNAIHIFEIDADGAPSIRRLNVKLAP